MSVYRLASIEHMLYFISNNTRNFFFLYSIQVVPQFTSTASQTTWFRKVNSATQYEAAELPPHLRAISLSSPSLSSFLARLFETNLGLALQQNSSFDAFRPDFPDLVEEEETTFGGKADNILKEIQSFTDLAHSKDKPLSCIDWMPGAKGVVAVACLETSNFEDRISQSGKVRSSIILIWNFVDPIHPQALLESPSDVTCMRFHPSIPTTLVAGCANGQVIFYDLSSTLTSTSPLQESKKNREGDKKRVPLIQYSVASSIEAGHRTTVLDLVWLPPSMEVSAKGKLNVNTDAIPPLLRSASIKGLVPDVLTYQFATSAPDGQILIWDTRFRKDYKEMDLLWVPIFRINLTRADMKEELTLTSISISTSSVNTKMVAATEEGELVFADWGPHVEGNRVQFIYPWHHGPIRSLERSPFFEDILLTVGDWTVSIWKEGTGSRPLLGSPYNTSGATVGRWSPTRPGVFYVGHVDGSIDVWDLLDKTHVPTLSQQIAPCAVISMEFLPVDTSATRQSNILHQFVVGDEAGTLHLLEVPKNLARQAPNERAMTDAFLKREQSRIEYNTLYRTSLQYVRLIARAANINIMITSIES